VAINKKTLFETSELELADLFKALAHPARIAIVKTLAAKEQCICGDLVDELPLAQATVSQHLKALRESGLIKGEIEGVRSCYCLDHERLARFRDEIDSLFTFMNQFKRNDNCC